MAVNRVERLIINLDTAMPMMCAWDECDRHARTTHQVRVHEHLPHIPCATVNIAGGDLGRHMIYPFCCERHLQYWVYCSGARAHDAASRNRGRIYGQLPPGMKRSVV